MPETDDILFTPAAREEICRILSSLKLTPTDTCFFQEETRTVVRDRFILEAFLAQMPICLRAEALLDEFIGKTNHMQDTMMLVVPADQIWSNLKDLREKIGLPTPLLWGK